MKYWHIHFGEEQDPDAGCITILAAETEEDARALAVRVAETNRAMGKFDLTLPMPPITLCEEHTDARVLQAIERLLAAPPHVRRFMEAIGKIPEIFDAESVAESEKNIAEATQEGLFILPQPSEIM